MEDKSKSSLGKELSIGTKVWATIIDFRNRTDVKYIAGEVKKLSSNREYVTVKFDDNTVINTDGDEPNTFPLDKISLRSPTKLLVEDLVLLRYINEPEIATGLKNRYEQDDVYTYCGTTLVSVNPYCLFQGEYSLQKKLEYKAHLKNSFFIMQKIPPHIYSIALCSVHEMFHDSASNRLSLCMGGESGSGKTEGSLYCLDFIVFACEESPQPGSIESRILNSHTLLAAFGNAKTMHNDNSSRFSKYISVTFDAQAKETKKIVGFETKTYLLEKSRAVFSGPDERKFHFLYSLDKALTPEQKDKYKYLDNFGEYAYLSESIRTPCANDDVKIYQDVMQVFKIFEVPESEIEGMFYLISLILRLGNISFQKESAVPKFVDSPDLEVACALIGTTKEVLEEEFGRKPFGKSGDTGGGFKQLSLSECTLRKDVLAKCLYDGLFTWVVSKLKDTGALDKSKAQKSIGILDISGFENLTYNSLEQLCINYSNEKALKLFIHSYFEEEKALFQAEGLNKYISDNKPKNNDEVMKVIDNSKGAPKGVFQKLEDCITFDQNYGSFTVGIADALKNSPLFSKSKTRSDKFTIIHSCYPIEYTAKDFVDKVKDELPSNLLQLINKSNPTMGSVITKVLQMAMDNNKMINYCEQFRTGINSLITELEKSRCNFVRCIKPNQQKASATWETDLVLNQIKTLGMSDYLSLKKRMYPLRVDFTEFCKKYLELNTKENQMYYELEANSATNFKELAKQTYQLANNGVEIKDENLIFGKKKIFANYSTFDMMDKKLEETFSAMQAQKAILVRQFEKYWLRKNFGVFSANLKRSMKIGRVLILCWLYKVKDYQKYKRFLELVRRAQWDFRFMKLRRKHRVALEKAKYHERLLRMSWDRYKFVKQKKAMQCIMRRYFLTKFQLMIHGRIAVRELIIEEYYGRIWKSILDKIYSKSALEIQSTFRGYLSIKSNFEKVKQLEGFKQNYRQNQAASRIQGSFKMIYFRNKLRKVVNASVTIQKFWRWYLTRRAYKGLQTATITLQYHVRKWLKRTHKLDHVLQEKMDSGEFAKWQELTVKENSTVFSINFVNSIPISERRGDRLNKMSCNMSFIPDMKPYALKKLKVYSYIIDVDPIVDPKDTYNSLWSIPYLNFLRRAREEYGSNMLHLSIGETHTIASTDNSKVYSWGGSNLYQLGFFDSYSKSHPKECRLSVRPSTANYLMAGNNHNVMWSSAQGKLFSWGDNSYGQLGLGHYSNVRGLVDISHLCRGKHLSQVETRGDLNAILIEDGSAQVWPLEFDDSGNPEPILIRLPSMEKIASIAVGLDFVMLATEKGRLFSFGKTNSCGELGLGDTNPRSTPTLLETLATSGDHAVQISCGVKHTVMRNQNGKVFTWGWGERGQLGHESDKNNPLPKKVLFKSSGGFSYQAMNVQAGYRASYALLQERRLFCWGSNGKILKVTVPTEYTDSGNDEIYYCRNLFKPMKICTTWSKSMCVTYMIVGDVRYLENPKHPEWEVLLKKVYNQWEKNYYDWKPTFDSKTCVHLDAKLVSPLERTTVGPSISGTVGARSKTPNAAATILKTRAQDERKQRIADENTARVNLQREIGMLEMEMRKIEGKPSDSNKVAARKEESSMSRTTAFDKTRSKTPVLGGSKKQEVSHTAATKKPEPTNAELKEKYAHIEREFKRIMAKNPREWSQKESKFIEEFQKEFKR